MEKYNKLVRDEIPNIIETQGGKAVWHVARTEEEYRQKLAKKLIEEVDEFRAENGGPKAIIELADVLEVTLALSKLFNFSEEKLKEAETVDFEEACSLLQAVKIFTNHPSEEGLFIVLGAITFETEELGIPWNLLEQTRAERARKRGAFTKRIILERS